MDRVLIFDTTLRDGEQSPGCTLNVEEQLEVAHALARLGVDIIEGGFPISSPGDFEAVRLMAEQIRDVQICGLARAVPIDIDRAGEAVRGAANGRIHVFISSSDIHLMHQMRKGREDVSHTIRAMVRRARNLCDNVEFSPMDATRSDPAYVVDILRIAVEEGATTLNIPDTVGYTTPEEYFALIRRIMNEVPGIEKCIISTHTHNDLGLAVANALAGAQAGARQIECTINGIGERAGNASLEEVVMALKTRGEHFNLTTGVDTTQIYAISQLVSRRTGSVVQANKAIIGRNAFRHESGIHQDAMLKDRSTFEIMNPQDVGLPASELVLGKHSGRHALRERLIALGFRPDETELNRIFEEFKALADARKEVGDSDIIAIVGSNQQPASDDWILDSIAVSTGGIPSATVQLSRGGMVWTEAAVGVGPIDALFKTIDRVIGHNAKLVDFDIRAIGKGSEAIGESTITLETAEGQGFTGRGAASDIVLAAARAYVNALNQLIHNRSAAVVAVA